MTAEGVCSYCSTLLKVVYTYRSRRERSHGKDYARSFSSDKYQAEYRLYGEYPRQVPTCIVALQVSMQLESRIQWDACIQR